VLEDETGETLNYQFKLFHERALPDLGSNIKCGNSLIGPDFYDGKQMNLLDTEEAQRVNVFDWQAEFLEIFQAGGFDAVIGNPPYLAFHEGSIDEKKYYSDKFISSTGKYDQYVLFVEKSLNLLNRKGYFSFIIPNKFIHSGYGEGIKKVILKNKIHEIVDFNDHKVFKDATNYPCIILITKDSGNRFDYKKVISLDSGQFKITSISIYQNSLTEHSWILVDRDVSNLINKICNNKQNLEYFSEAITQGLRTGQLKVFFNNISHELIKSENLEKELIIPVFHGSNVKRYFSAADSNTDLLLFPYKTGSNIPVNINLYPNIKNYLLKYKMELDERKDSGKIFKNTNKKWFEYWDAKPKCFDKPKIIFPDISSTNNFNIDFEGIGYLNTCYAIFPKKDVNVNTLLGILNSKIVEYFLKNTCPFIRGGFYRYKTNYIKKIPIPFISENNNCKISRLVEQMLFLHKQLAETKTGHEQKLLQRQIDATDKQIDKLVYELYGLTEEEIAIVEGK